MFESWLMISVCHIALFHCNSLTVKSQLSHKVFFFTASLKPDVESEHLFEQRSASQYNVHSTDQAVSLSPFVAE